MTSAWSGRTYDRHCEAGRTRRVRAAALIVATLLPLPLAAEPLFSFDATQGRLPKTAVPVSYQVELTPDLDRLTIAGQETIELELRQPAARIRRHDASR